MYEVLNDFIEKEHEGTVYRKGETYPMPGYSANEKRVAFLQRKHSEYGVKFLDTPKETVKTAKKANKKSGEV